MSISLVVEVMDHAPDTLTSGERLVLIVIAEWANDNTRIARQTGNWTLDTICKRAGIKRSGLKSVLQGLARKGLEVRVPVKVKDGKPVYAHEGRALTFRLPDLTQRGGHSIPTERPEGMPQPPRGEAVASERGGHSLPHPLNVPSDPSSLSARVNGSAPSANPKRERDDPRTSRKPDLRQPADNSPRSLVAHAGDITDPDEADRVVEKIVAENDVRNPQAFFLYAAENGTLPGLVARARGGAQAEPSKAPPKPWCGRCYGDNRRFILARLPSGIEKSIRCPDCHRAPDPIPDGAAILTNAT